MSRIHTGRFVSILMLVSFSIPLLIDNVVGGEDPKPSPSTSGAPSPGPSATAEPNRTVASLPIPEKKEVPRTSCIVDESAIEDMNMSKREIELKKKDLAAREAEILAREKALHEELKKLEELRNEITTTHEKKLKEKEDKITKLMDTFITMSPKVASQVVADMDDDLAVAVMSKMETPKLAKIMNAMLPKRSSQLSELLAGVVRAKSPTTTSNGVAATTDILTKKGGEKTNGDNQSNNSSK